MKSIDKFRLAEFGLIELNQEELILVNGGDKFTRDLGNLIGQIGRTIVNTFSTPSDPWMNQVPPVTLFG
jgi:hypothetical protein